MGSRAVVCYGELRVCVVTLTFASWNQIGERLSQLEAFRQTA